MVSDKLVSVPFAGTTIPHDNSSPPNFTQSKVEMNEFGVEELDWHSQCESCFRWPLHYAISEWVGERHYYSLTYPALPCTVISFYFFFYLTYKDLALPAMSPEQSSTVSIVALPAEYPLQQWFTQVGITIKIKLLEKVISEVEIEDQIIPLHCYNCRQRAFEQ